MGRTADGQVFEAPTRQRVTATNGGADHPRFTTRRCSSLRDRSVMSSNSARAVEHVTDGRAVA